MRNRDGASLIEVMVALVLFGVIVSVHTVATMRYGVRQRFAAIGAARSAASPTRGALASRPSGCGRLGVRCRGSCGQRRNSQQWT